MKNGDELENNDDIKNRDKCNDIKPREYEKIANYDKKIYVEYGNETKLKLCGLKR